MKKIYPVLLLTLICSMAIGQRKMKPNQTPIKGLKAQHPMHETYLLAPLSVVHAGTNSVANNSYGTQVGTTFYDYQTNGSMPNRIQLDPNYNLTAIWIKGPQNDPSGTNRRVGYSFYNKQSQSWSPEETIGDGTGSGDDRRGWPFLMTDQNGHDILGSHTPQARHYRDTAGTGAWQNDLLKDISDSVNSTDPYESGWGGAATASGDTIHHIAAGYAPDGLQSFKYSRSPDNSNTWDLQDVVLPGMSFATWTGNIGLNAYDAFAIDSRGSTVAITAGGWDQSIHLWKSTDRGDNWTYNRVFIFDTLFAERAADGSHNHLNGDEGLAIAVGPDGKVHIATGMVGIVSPPGQIGGSTNFFGFQQGLIYWNEDMGFDNYLDDTLTNDQFIILEYYDENGDGQNTTPQVYDSVGRYFNHGIIAFPSISIGTNNTVNIVWSAVREDAVLQGIFLQPSADGNSKIHRDIYSWASCDGGSTWEIDSIKNIADDIDGVGAGFGTPVEEDVFVQAYTKIGGDNMIHILFQTDDRADRNWDATSPATPNENFIVHYSYHVNETGCITGLQNPLERHLSWKVFPNPANTQLNIGLDIIKPGNYTISVNDLMGREIRSNTFNMNKGSAFTSIDVSDLTAGIYLVNISTEGKVVSKKVVIE